MVEGCCRRPLFTPAFSACYGVGNDIESIAGERGQIVHIPGDCAETIHLMKTKFRAFTLLAVLLTAAISAFAQLPPEALAGLWKAQWITSPSAPERDPVVLHLRKVIEVSRVPENFVVHVSADSLFILNVNQREVGRGPARSDLAHWKYETYDLAPFLRPGRNEIAAMVWSLGVSIGAQISDRTAFVLSSDSSEASVANTDKSWEEYLWSDRRYPSPETVPAQFADRIYRTTLGFPVALRTGRVSEGRFQLCAIAKRSPSSWRVRDSDLRCPRPSPHALGRSVRVLR